MSRPHDETISDSKLAQLGEVPDPEQTIADDHRSSEGMTIQMEQGEGPDSGQPSGSPRDVHGSLEMTIADRNAASDREKSDSASDRIDATMPDVGSEAVNGPGSFEGGVNFGGTDQATGHRISRLLAEGGLGAVFVAQDDKLKREVVMKKLKEGHGASANARRRFVREAQINSQLEHPNIIPIYQGGDGSDGQPYYTMKYARGENFKTLIRSYHHEDNLGVSGSLELRRLLSLFMATCQAMSYAHSRGVVHRDLKPENIAVGEFGELMVLDWGLAKVLDEPDTDSPEPRVVADTEESLVNTLAGDIMGTPAYMAPEQAAGDGGAIEPRTDIYALGAILFEILTGHAPHSLIHTYTSEQIHRWDRRESTMRLSGGSGQDSAIETLFNSGKQENTIELLARVRSGVVPSVADIAPAAPRALEAVCSRAMSLEKADRYATASELARDVERWLADEPVSVYAGNWNERLGRWTRKHRSRVQAIGAAIVVVAVVAVVSLVIINHQRQLAVDQRHIAESASVRAQEAERVAVVNRKLAERSTFTADLLLLQRDWANASILRIQRTLEKYGKRSGDMGFAWKYWNRRIEGYPSNFEGHQAVADVSFSPDGTRVASAGIVGTVKIWDVVNGKETFNLAGHSSSVRCVDFSPDSSRLASGSHDKTIRIWDTETGDHLLTIDNEKGVAGLSFSPDGRKLASSAGMKIKVWDVSTGERLQEWTAHAGPLMNVAYSPDGKRLASCSFDGRRKIWDAKTGKQLMVIPIPGGIPYGVDFSPDGKRLASCSFDNRARVFDVATGKKLLTLTGHTLPVVCIKFGPRGRFLGTSSGDNTVRIWDAKTGDEVRSFKGHVRFGVRNVDFSPDGTRVVSGGLDGSIKIWDTNENQDAMVLAGQVQRVQRIHLSPNGIQLASTNSRQPIVKVWDTQAGAMARKLVHATRVTAVRFSDDGKFLATGCGDSRITLWDAKSWKQVLTCEGKSGVIQTLLFHPKQKRMVSAGTEGGIKVWDTRTGELKLEWEQVPGTRAIIFSPDGESLVTAGDDKTIRFWDPLTGKETRTLEGHEAKISRLCFSRDGATLASAGGRSGVVKLWDVETGKNTDTWQCQGRGVSALDMSPDGTEVVTTGVDQTVKLWDRVTGREQISLRGSGDVQFSSDGQRLIASDVRSIKIWDSRPWTPRLRAMSRARGFLAARRSEQKSLEAFKNSIQLDQTINEMEREFALEWASLYWNSRR